MRRSFRIGTPAFRRRIVVCVILLSALLAPCLVFVAPALLAAEGWGERLALGLALAAPPAALVPVLNHARRMWDARIETDGDLIAYVSRSRRVEGSLRELAELQTLGSEAGEAYRILWPDGRRITFGDRIEDAELLRRQIEAATGKTFRAP